MNCPSPFRIVPLVAIDSTMYVTNAVDEVIAAYNPAEDLVKGDERLFENRLYIAQKDMLAAATVQPDIGDLNDVPEWVLKGAINSHAMFDSEVNTQTENDDVLIVTITPKQIVTTLSLLDIDASDVRIEQVDIDSGAVLFDQSYDSVSTLGIVDPWSYSYLPIRTDRTLIIHALKAYSNHTIRVTINRPNGKAKCGMCAIGTFHEVGYLIAGGSGRILDFSNNRTDKFGVTTFVKRQAVKLLSLPLKVPTNHLDWHFQTLEDLRSTPFIVSAMGANGFKSLDLLAYYDDFDFEYPKISTPKTNVTLDLIGLI